MAAKDRIDFLVIGAQKAGTTSLFEYVRAHPSVYMPPEKEAAYFTEPEAAERSFAQYLDEVFGGAPGDRVWGTATPHYMRGLPWIPERIHGQLPDVKLVALLRNPIERALSHHRMSTRRGWEARSAPDAFRDLAEPKAAEMARAAPDETNAYLVWGEYGRILSDYVRVFGREPLLVLFTEDLERDPEDAVRRVFRHVGVDETFRPPNLGRRYHVGGSRRRFPKLGSRLRAIPPVRWAYQLLPLRIRRRVAFRFEQWNTVPDAPAAAAPSGTEALVDYFADDVAKLTELAGPVPWPEWR